MWCGTHEGEGRAQEKGALVEVLEWGGMGGPPLERALCGLQRASVGYQMKPSFVSLVVFSSGTAEMLESVFWQCRQDLGILLPEPLRAEAVPR